jgi:hypothetical protein
VVRLRLRWCLSYAVRAPPRRRAEPVDDPVVHDHLDDPPAIAVAADDATGLEHPCERKLGGATEIDDGLDVHRWSSLPVRISRLSVEG